MSPKAVNYKANSIVYFKGDVNERVYILKTGKVLLKYNDIETGQELQDAIRTGEFFGVKSALGKYPREETAVVVQNSSMVTFSVPEFEQLAMKNTRIIMKMLKVFSNQLRRIHKQVQNLLSTGGQVNPETGLFRIGQYYMNSGSYSQAAYAFRRYLTYYPSGKYAGEANEGLQEAESKAQNGGASSPSGGGPTIGTNAVAGSSGRTAATGTDRTADGSGRSPGREMSDVAKTYYNAVSLFSQEKFKDALRQFKQIVNQGQDKEYGIKALFEIGRCMYAVSEYDDCIQHYTTMIQRYPKHPDLADALFYVGSCHEKSGNTDKAGSFYKKIVAMTSDDAPINRKAKKALRKLGGG